MNLNLKAQAQNTYDVIVVGSGISGGWAAMEMTKKGQKVLLLERGRQVEHVTDYPTANLAPWELEHRGKKTLADEERYKLSARNYGVSEANKHFYVDEVDFPYVQTQNEYFVWARGYQVGGRSLIWGRQCYRFSDLDFEANAKEGVGVDWPIRYKDIAPWYSYAERFVGITGSKEGLPHLPDGEFLKPMEMSCLEKHVSAEIHKQYPDRRMIIGRTANLTEAKEGRGVCMYRNMCDRGCPYGGYFSSNSATLPVAMQTGNLTLRPHSIVLNVLYDETTQKAKGVTVLDAENGETHEYYARIIFLNASTIGTTLIMQNSTSSRFPNGLGNDSGALGHYLMTHHKSSVGGEYDGFLDNYFFGRRANGIYVPRFRNVTTAHPDFLRGYNFQGGGSRPRRNGMSFEGFGAELKAYMQSPADGWRFTLSSFGEQLPYYENAVQISPTLRDKQGGPVAEITFEWKENEFKMAKDAVEQGIEMLEKAGLTKVKGGDLDPPKSTVHEVGTARMGHDPKTSVLNKHNQVWGCSNVFVTDGACMPSVSCVNPSLTYMALTARACDFALSEMQKQNL